MKCDFVSDDERYKFTNNQNWKVSSSHSTLNRDSCIKDFLIAAQILNTHIMLFGLSVLDLIFIFGYTIIYHFAIVNNLLCKVHDSNGSWVECAWEVCVRRLSPYSRKWLTAECADALIMSHRCQIFIQVKFTPRVVNQTSHSSKWFDWIWLNFDTFNSNGWKPTRSRP